ncbi:MAG: hypothetical protein ACI9U2_003376 [Bradymonadia bacterium]|jgi:hypothetical protein
MSLRTAGLHLAVLGLVACSAGKSASLEPIVTGLLVPQPVDQETYAETLTAMAVLDDGGYLQVQLAISNIGIGSGKGACRVLWVPAKGTPQTAQTTVDREGWSARPDRLKVGRCSATITEGLYTVHAPLDPPVRIELHATPQRHHPPGHRIQADDDFHVTEVLVPFANATVHIGDTRRSGRGYADRSRSTALPGDLATRWVRVRRLSSAGLLMLSRTPPSGPPQVWRWREGKTAEPASLVAERVGDAWRITAPGTPPILTEGLIYRHAPVEDQGMLSGMIRAIIGNPVTYTYRIPGGVLEVTHVNE